VAVAVAVAEPELDVSHVVVVLLDETRYDDEDDCNWSRQNLEIAMVIEWFEPGGTLPKFDSPDVYVLPGNSCVK
jgi:hypothetical protein